ncbi:MAG: hypothetical protein A2218_12215 [Elusimicrobia bacterium RIFOXYA2_FULL_53_38]|nr:MAG: hypothetical protein A2218_12215 [Elusimicrobia bacterium RIFOXYA2_FULL_53_38]
MLTGAITMKKNLKFGIAAAVCAALLSVCAHFPAQGAQPDPRGSGLSRSTEQAIRLYHEGQDNEAMDRFMDILVKGTPSEKSLANSYISRITLRMNTGVPSQKDQGADGGVLKEVEGDKQVQVRQQPGFKDLAPSEEEAAAQEEPEAQKTRIADKINARIADMRRGVLLHLGESDAVKLYMSDPLPRALTINPQYFFANDTVFKPNATAVLSNLAGLMFTLGRATIRILPEGTVMGDVKIKSIRQAIALNSYLVSRGISQSRIDVNLTGADIKFPKELNNISGLIVLFDYDKEPRLNEPDDLQSKGPKVSLGIYPTAISIQKNEGALVEFSVFKSPIGQVSWKFEIFSVQPDNSIGLLQKTDNIGPLCKQSYWNGRKNFFGAPYASGKYMFSITATDVEGRETNLRRLLVIKPGPGEEKALAAQKNAAKPKVESKNLVPSGTAKTAKGKQALSKKAKAPLKKGKAGLKTAKAVAKGKSKKGGESAPPPKKEASEPSEDAATKGDEGKMEEAAQDPQTEFSGQVSYKIYFREETAIVTPNSEKKLTQVAETMNYYPMAKIKLIGYAYSGEANSETMAQNRVNYVATRLNSKYAIEKDRMDVSTQISDTPKSIVEIKMLGKE